MITSKLTTTDNPFDPFDNPDEWEVFDETFGYYSRSLLDRVVKTSDTLSPELINEAICDGIDEIVKYNLSGMHTKVTRDDSDEPRTEDEAFIIELLKRNII